MGPNLGLLSGICPTPIGPDPDWSRISTATPTTSSRQEQSFSIVWQFWRPSTFRCLCRCLENSKWSKVRLNLNAFALANHAVES
eukprot:scaffold948_cov106-Cylindrotheca_fusiformis.AAC.17